jgi:hypothetical protein
MKLEERSPKLWCFWLVAAGLSSDVNESTRRMRKIGTRMRSLSDTKRES